MKNSSLFKLEVAFHPGETLKETLQDRSISMKVFAELCELPDPVILAVVEGHFSVTTEMATVFERVLSIPAHFWLNKQRLFDEYQALPSR